MILRKGFLSFHRLLAVSPSGLAAAILAALAVAAPHSAIAFIAPPASTRIEFGNDIPATAENGGSVDVSNVSLRTTAAPKAAPARNR